MLVLKVSQKIKSIEAGLLNIYSFVVGVLKILVLSKYFLRLPKAKNKSCIILGNGPSLAQTIHKYKDIVKSADLFCVNNFATSNEFEYFKPSNMVLLDPGFFKFKTRKDIVDTFYVLKNNVHWKLNLYIPYIFRNDKDVCELKNSKYIKIVFYNYTLMKGIESWIFPFYKWNLAMPQFYNVLGAALYLAINSKYKEIYVVGADHTWTDNLEIGNDNVVYRKDIHFYDNNEQEVKLLPMIEPVSESVINMGSLYGILSLVFNSYYILNRYAKYRKTKIYNASEFSYIDSFERKSLLYYDLNERKV